MVCIAQIAQHAVTPVTAEADGTCTALGELAVVAPVYDVALDTEMAVARLAIVDGRTHSTERVVTVLTGQRVL